MEVELILAITQVRDSIVRSVSLLTGSLWLKTVNKL